MKARLYAHCIQMNKASHSKEQKEAVGQRTSVMISKSIHQAHCRIATLVGKSLREASDEAIRDWNDKHSKLAQRRANELLKPA